MFEYVQNLLFVADIKVISGFIALLSNFKNNFFMQKFDYIIHVRNLVAGLVALTQVSDLEDIVHGSHP